MKIGNFVLFEKKRSTPIAFETPASSAGGEVPEPEVYSLSATAIQNLYINNSWIRKYVNSIIRGCLQYKLQAVLADPEAKNQKGLQEQLLEINNLLNYSNPSEVFSDVREKYLKDFLLFGNGALEISPRKGAEVKELYAAPGYLLRAKYDEAGNMDPKQAYFFVDPENNEVDTDVPYRIVDIVHFKLDQLSDRFYGISPISSIYSEITADQRCQRDMSRGDFGVPHQLLTFPKQTKSFIDKVMGSIQTLLTGRGGNKVIAVNVDGVESVKLSEKNYEDEFNFQKWLVQRHNVYGIPPFKLGFVSEVGSMSSKEQREEFSQLVETFVTYECEKLTLILCKSRLGYEGIKVVAPALITRLDYEKARVLDRLVGQGIITPNEAREKYLGMSKIDDPSADTLKIKTFAPPPTSQIFMQPAIEKEESPEDKALKLKKLELLGKQAEILDELSKKE
jgi:hypothetical protein